MAVLKRCPIPTGRVSSIVPVAIVLSFLLTGCLSDDSMSTFSRDGDVASLQFDIFVLIWWLMVGVFVVVEGMLLYTVLRFRKKPGEPDMIPAQTHGNTRLEIAWTIAPTLVLLALMIPTVQGLGYLSEKQTGDAINVKVVAHQWWWEFQYPELGVSTANELHIPVGKSVNFELESADVIHSFWVPRLAGKQDVVPNRRNTMWFNAKEPGEYYGQCAELCGISHALMKFRVIAQPQGEFEAWVNGEKSPQPPPTGRAAEGSTLFLSKGCIACHTIRGNPAAQAKIGPDLTHVGSRTMIAAGLLENNTNNLTKWLRDPNEVKPGNIMARDALAYKEEAFRLTDEDISKLVAYLQSLK